MRSLLIFLFAGFYFLGFSQNIQFYFGGNHHIAEEVTHSGDILSNTYIGNLADSFLIQQQYNATITARNDFETYPGFAFGMNIDWQLNEKVSLRSGLGFTSTSMWHSRSVSTVLGEPTGVVDTFPIIPFVGSNPCTFTNTLSDFGDYERRPKYSLLTLQIPIKLNYQINEQFGFTLGTALRTPITSNRKQISVPVETTTNDDGDEICTYVLHEINDRTGRDFRDLTILFEAEIYWWLGDFGVSLGGGKMVSNLFVNAPSSNSFGSSISSKLEYSPWIGGFKVMYRLNKKVN